MKNNAEANIRYTTVLPAKHIEELKQLAAHRDIPSVNYGIREAISHYLVETRRELYAQKMAEAVEDQGYLERTLDTQVAYAHVDSEVSGEW